MRTLLLVLILAMPLDLTAQVSPAPPRVPREPTADLQAALMDLQGKLEPLQAQLEPLDLQLEPLAFAMEPFAFQMEPFAFQMEPLAFQMDAQAYQMDAQGFQMDAQAVQMGAQAVQMGAQAKALDAQMSALGAQLGSLDLPYAAPDMAVEGASGFTRSLHRRMPPAPDAQQQSPADTLYRAAREAMSRNRYDRAAELFARIAERYARSSYAPDAYYWQAFNLYRVGGDENLKHALDTLERQGERFPEAQTRRSGDAQTLATRIRGQLARQGDAAAAAKIAQDAQQAEAGCDTTDQDMRVAALNALLQMNAEQALPVLKKVLARRDACSANLRRKAVFLLSQKEAPETVDIMMDVAKNDPNLEVRRQAVFWLSQVEDPRAVDALDQILKTSKDEELQKRALFALSQHDSPRAYTILKQAAENQQMSEDLRKYAITWIAQHKDADIAYLKHLYGTLKDPTLKERVLFAIAQSDKAGAADWLLGVATDTTGSIALRKRAIFWAGQANASIAAMGRLYDQVQSRELKEQLLFAFSQSDDSAAVDRLIQIAKTEKDPDLRKRAIFWLGQSDDPRAAKALMDIIGA